MDASGTFVSEVYRNGRTYFFEANYSPLQWTATIWAESGRPNGAIACRSTARRLTGEALEDAVCEWVHRAVQHEVGFLADSGIELSAVGERCRAVENAANAAHYGAPKAERPSGSNFPDDLQALLSHSRQLRQQSSGVMARFLELSRNVFNKAAPQP